MLVVVIFLITHVRSCFLCLYDLWFNFGPLQFYDIALWMFQPVMYLVEDSNVSASRMVPTGRVLVLLACRS